VTAHSARATLDAARGIFAAPNRYTAPELWQSAQGVLQSVIGRPELTGQALVSEVRQLGLINLADAHALVALAAWADRSTGLAENEAERILVREAWMALEHAIPEAPISGFASAPAGTPPTNAPPASAPHQAWSPGGGASGGASPSGMAAPPPVMGYAGDTQGTGKARRRWLWPAVGVTVLLAALAGAGTWWFTTGKPERELTDAISAYQRGSREVARTTFAQLAMQHPDDARPLIYLGRITREDGDLARARTFLTNAVRLAPESAVAARELASIMLAEGQPEIARRFYVRALQLDPSDRSAQGFLGCALVRLGRFEEAPRWIQRAGPGEWQQCLASMPALQGMPAPYPMSPPR
jgi:tetratricopeptide (TPR) repeat protein